MTRNDERFWGETRPRKQLAAIEGFAPGEVSCKVCGLQFVLDEKTLRNQVCKCLLGTREPLCLPLVSNEERPEIADNDSLKIETDYRVHSILTGVEAQSLAAGIGRGGTGNPGGDMQAWTVVGRVTFLNQTILIWNLAGVTAMTGNRC